MKKRFTRIMAAMMLLVTLAIPMGMKGQTTETLNIASYASANSWVNQTQYATATVGSVTFTAYGGSNTGKYYTTDNSWRFYANESATLTISVPSGNTLSSVTATFTVKDYGTVSYNNSTISSGEAVTVSGNSAVFNIGQSSGNKGKIFFTEIAVTYTSGDTPTPTTYTVTYNANGGTGTMTDSNSPYNSGATVTVLANTFTRDNYTFSKWNTAANGSGTDYDAEDTFTINANTTLYAQWTENASGDEQWVLTSLTDLTSSDVFVIVGNNGSNYAMKNTGATSSGPAAIAVTVSGNKLTGTVSSDIKWNISGNATTGYVFYPNGSTTTWLYCNNDNNGLRIGNGNTDYNTFELKSDYIYNKGRGRYIGVYNSTNWRSYTSIGSNISGQTFAFYKKVTSGVTPPSISANNVSIAYGDTNGSISYTINDEPTPAGSLSAVINAGSTIANLQIGTITSSVVPFTCTANTEGTARTATVTLTYTYGNNETVTQTVTITQAAVPVIYTTIPALFEAATSTETSVFVTFNNWVVSGVSTNGKSVYVTDNSGNGFIIYFTSDMSGTFAAGDILSGTAVACKLKLYNGAAELVNLTATDLTVTTGGTVSISNIPMSDLSGVNTGALVSYSNLACSVTTSTSGENTYTNYDLTDGTTTIRAYTTLYDFTTTPDLEDGKTYNIKGIFQQYNTTKEIMPRSAADIVEVTIPVINAENISIAYDATSGEIPYTIDNPVSGQNLTATSTAAWISNITVASDKVTFTATANEDDSDRTATVTLSYTGATDKVITVTQGHFVIDYAVLPFVWEGGASAAFLARNGPRTHHQR